MTISYLGHSSFLLVSNGGTRIVTDPYGGIGYPFPRVSADLVTVSHGHYDHAETSAVSGKFVVADRAGQYTLGDIKARAVPCWHDDVNGRKRGSNLAFCFTADGMTVCHLGDIGQPAGQDFIKQLGRVDILMIPVGGLFTVDARGAKEYVDAIRPKITIPMHFKTRDLNIGIEPPDRFLGLFPSESILYVKGAFTADEDFGDGKIVFMERVG